MSRPPAARPRRSPRPASSTPSAGMQTLTRPTSGPPADCLGSRLSPATPPSWPVSAARKRPPTTSPRSTAASSAPTPSFAARAAPGATWRPRRWRGLDPEGSDHDLGALRGLIPSPSSGGRATGRRLFYETRNSMALKVAIVGLPNVGKSTLFNALTQTAAAQAANYPFCTIEPNVGDVAVPEPRLEKLAAIAGSKEIIPARINFVDIAGLVRGASSGEGLGNQFLANIRDCDAIAFVARCFEDDDITHVEGRVDPLADLDTIETELMLADLESLEKRGDNLEKRAKSGGDKEAALTLKLGNLALNQ